jgi:biotin carboxyl carrier protein
MMLRSCRPSITTNTITTMKAAARMWWRGGAVPTVTGILPPTNFLVSSSVWMTNYHNMGRTDDRSGGDRHFSSATTTTSIAPYRSTRVVWNDATTNTTTTTVLPYHLVVGLPALSPTMEVGTLAEWYVQEGDTFHAGDALAKIETDKAAMDFEAQDDGVVAKILIAAGDGADSYVYICLYIYWYMYRIFIVIIL